MKNTIKGTSWNEGNVIPHPESIGSYLIVIKTHGRVEMKQMYYSCMDDDGLFWWDVSRHQMVYPSKLNESIRDFIKRVNGGGVVKWVTFNVS